MRICAKKVIKILVITLFLGVFLLNNNFIQAESLININTASESELDELPGIGPTIAGRIVDYREANDGFEKIEDIKNVSGIGDGIYNDIKDLITVDEGGESGDVEGDESENETCGSYDLVINELIPNPEGSDDAEWVEIKNNGSEAVDIAGWKIVDESGGDYVFDIGDFISIVIEPGEFFVLERSVSGVSLNNNGDSLSLMQNENCQVDYVAYSDSRESASWARDELGEWSMTTTVTKGEENVIDEPVEQISGGAVSERADSEYEGKVFINELFINPIGIDNGQTEWIEIYNDSRETICLYKWKLIDNEREYELPEKYLPAGGYIILNKKDTGIALQNENGDRVVLIGDLGWDVDQVNYKSTKEGWSYSWCSEWDEWQWIEESTPGKKNNCPVYNMKPKAYFEMSDSVFDVGDYLQVSAEESFDEDGEIVYYRWFFENEVEAFGEAKKEWQFENDWFEVKVMKVGRQKIILEIEDDLGGVDRYEKYFEVSGIEREELENSKKDDEKEKKMPRQNIQRNFSINEIGGLKKLEKKTNVFVRGVVVVEPGVLGKNIFYINDEDGGVQVYNFQKDFPAMSLGDRVEVRGEISSVQGETRVKTSNGSDIVVIGQGDLIEPKKLQGEDVEEVQEGRLIKLKGDLLEKSGSAIWIDDRTDEVKVYIKESSQVNVDEYRVGDEIEVVGIVSQWGDEYRVLPRYRDDIKLITSVKGSSSILNETAKMDESKSIGFWYYFITILVFAGGSVYFYKLRQKK